MDDIYDPIGISKRLKQTQDIIDGISSELAVVDGKVNDISDIKDTANDIEIKVGEIDENVGETTDAEGEDGAVLPRLKWVINTIRKGAGSVLASGKSILDAVGHDGDSPIASGLHKETNTDRLGAVGDAESETGTVLQRLAWSIEGIRKGAGTVLGAGKSLVDAIGHDGTTDLDSGVTGKIHDVTVAGYDSTAITANEDGSVMERLEDLHDDVQDTLVRTQNTLTADGTEQNIYENDDTVPFGVPQIAIDLSNMDADDIVIIRPSVKINSAGDFKQIGTDVENTYTGVQSVGEQVIFIDSIINQEGYKVTLEHTAQVNGYKNFDIEIFEV